MPAIVSTTLAAASTRFANVGVNTTNAQVEPEIAETDFAGTRVTTVADRVKPTAGRVAAVDDGMDRRSTQAEPTGRSARHTTAGAKAV
jgi:hypothetical protein